MVAQVLHRNADIPPRRAPAPAAPSRRGRLCHLPAQRLAHVRAHLLERQRRRPRQQVAQLCHDRLGGGIVRRDDADRLELAAESIRAQVYRSTQALGAGLIVGYETI